MTADQMREAGFTDEEIQSELSIKRLQFKQAGFTDMEIDAVQGPSASSPTTPKLLSAESIFALAPLGVMPLLAGDVQTASNYQKASMAINDFVKPWINPWKKVGYSTAEALNRGMAGFSAHLDIIAEYIEEKTGLRRGGFFEQAANQYNENTEYWKKRADEIGPMFLPELLGEAVGGAPAGISEFLLNIPYAAILGAAEAHKQGESEIGGALVNAAKRGVLGAVFHAMGPLKQYLRAPLMGGVFATQAVTEGGDAREIAKGFGTGLIYSAFSPGGRYGLNEIKSNARSYFNSDIEKSEIYSAAVRKLDFYKLEAEELNVIFAGAEGDISGRPVLFFTDTKTGMNFSPKEGESLAEAIKRTRREYVEGEVAPKPISEVVEGKQPWEMTREEWLDDAHISSAEGIEGASKTFKTEAEAIAWAESRGLTEEYYTLSYIRKGKPGEGGELKSVTVDIRSGRDLPGAVAVQRKATHSHKVQVQQAFAKGETIPSEVLKDYPELQKAAEAKVEPGAKEPIWRQSQRFPTKSAAQLQSILASDRLAKELGLEGSWQLERRVVKAPTGSGYVYEYRAEAPGAVGLAPEKGFERRLPEEGEAVDKPVSRSDIKKLLEEKLDVPIRTGRFRDKALGIFKLFEEVVRTKKANDIEVIAHEIGHGLQKFLWPESVKAKEGAKGMSALQFTPYSAELSALATKPRPGQPIETEGFAEFIRLYITNEALARKKAPQFYEHFDGLLENKSPEAREILLEARTMYDKYMKQPYLQRILSQISIGAKEAKSITFDDLYTKFVDDLHPLEVMVKAMTEGQPLEVSKNPYILARLMKGYHGKAEAFLKNAPFDFKTLDDIPGAKSLKAILDPVRDNLNEFRAYLVGKRALELNKRGIETGILKEDAQKAVDEYGARFAQVEKDLEIYQDALVAYLHDSGLIDTKTVLKMKEANRDYVPFYRVMEAQKNMGVGRGLSSRQPIKGIKGSWRDIIDPIESIIKNTFLYINLAEKNAIGQALVNLSKSKEGLGKFVEKIPTPLQKITIKEVELMSILQRYGKWTETQKFKQTERQLGEKISGVEVTGEAKALDKIEIRAREALSARGFSIGEVDQIINRLKNAKTPEDKQKIIEKTIEKITIIETVKEFGFEVPEGVIELFRASAFTPKKNIIQVWTKGKPSLYQVHPEIARTMQGLDRESMHTLIKLMSYPARWLRAGATLTPEFIGRNPLRDQFSAFIWSRFGFVPGFDLAKGIFNMAGKSDLYWDFKKSGADHSMLVSMDRDYMQENMQDILQKYPLSRVVRNPIQGLRLLSELNEMATRIGEYQRGIEKMGISKEGKLAAAFAAREVTLDFSRTGSSIRGSVNAIAAFSNAQIQDLDKIVRQFRDEPIQTSIRIAAMITLPSILLALHNSDDPRWKDIPQWQKDTFWIIMPDKITQPEWDAMTPEQKAQERAFVTGNIWRIPKPFTMGIIFGSIPERIVDHIVTKDPHAFDEFFATMGRALSINIIPTVLTPLFENWANKSLYFDKKIVPGGREDLLPEYQYSEYTTETAKKIGQIVGKVPVIGETWVASPSHVENLIRGWTGGLGKYALDIADVGLKATGIVEKGYEPATRTFSDIPFIRAFAVRYPSSDTAGIQRFYDSFEKANTFFKTQKFLIEKEADPARALQLYETSGMAKLDGIHKSLSNIRNVILLINKNPEITGDEKRQLIDVMYYQMIEIAGYGNIVFDEFEKAKKEAKLK